MGLSRPLPPNFVAFTNWFSTLKVDPEITKVRSALVILFDAVSWVYPLQLLLGFVAAALLMIMERTNPDVVVLTAGFWAVLASAPLYSQYAIGRYVLGSVVIGYLLIGLAAHSIMTRGLLSCVTREDSPQEDVVIEKH